MDKNIDMSTFIKGYFANQKAERVKRYRRMNMFVKKGQVLFAGSSLMEQFPINELQHNYNFSKIIYNRGIGGFIMKEFEDNLEDCVFALEPSKMFLNIGTNDMNDKEFDIDLFISNYERILDKIKDRLPNLKIYLMAYYPVNSDVAEGWIKMALENRTNERVNFANERVKEMAAKRNIKFIDVNEPLKDENKNLKAEYAIDGMHFYCDGYASILPLLAKYIEEEY